MTRFGDVDVSRGDHHVAVVEIRRPPNNFFDARLIASLAEAVETVDADSHFRVAVLCSKGKHFCAGAAFDPGGTDRDDRGNAGISELYDQAVRLFATRTPVVAAVQGAAIGGGLGLAAFADFRVAAPEARFSANFALLGFHHGFGLTVTLPAIVGQQHALDMLYTGRRIGGEEAAEMGLADQLVSLPSLFTAAIGLAAQIAAAAPLAVDAIRQTMRGGLAERVRAATTHELAEQTRLRRTSDFAEGVRATAERRPGRFTGR